ncbi:hypothetical protein CTI12_AA171680 [Artemisia annua]|uniref:Uncharacterized protein n=1 Tax=Artemisia annua TaxID=35608 RepID=A0A2U1P916_ARTAN|nr:hypothetical protein CTI12_AA171680 [Artemisia annua]
MIVPLPSVENACSLLLQEESQRLLFGSSSGVESTALYSKGYVKDKCSICGFKWHPPEKCWEKVGYPAWHPKHKVASRQSKPNQNQNRNQFQGVPRIAAHVESGNISFTPQQFEQLLKSVKQMNVFNGGEEEFDHQFTAGIACLSSCLDMLEILEDWIYDTGASDHMTPVQDDVFDPYLLQIKPQIRLPNGETLVISHVGKFLSPLPTTLPCNFESNHACDEFDVPPTTSDQSNPSSNAPNVPASSQSEVNQTPIQS